MFYQVANALHEALGIDRPSTEHGAVLTLKTHVAPEVARLRAIAAVVQQELGATDAAGAAAAIAQLRGQGAGSGGDVDAPARAE